MTEQQETVNIYLNKDNKEKVLSGASSHSRYIILMNETLQTNNRELTSQVKELETKNDELENDSDKSEIAKRYMTGLLKNFVEIDKMRVNIVKINDEIMVANNDVNKKFISKADKHFRFLCGMMIVILGFIWEVKYLSVDQFSLVFSLVFMLVSFCRSLMMNVPTLKVGEKEMKIKEIEIDIKKITDAQDFIHEYIDSI